MQLKFYIKKSDKSLLKYIESYYPKKNNKISVKL